MKVKIKVVPEDFLVEEVAHLPLSKKGDYACYLLIKKGWNTVELIQEIARKNALPFSVISYGGRKDRYGLTRQYIAIKNQKMIAVRDNSYSLQFVGFMQRPMGPDLLEGNKSHVVVRDLSALSVERVMADVETLCTQGYPNYFDDQRFGSFDPLYGFFAEKVLKNQFNGALKIYLAAGNEFFLAHWKEWETCLLGARTAIEKEAFRFLCAHRNGFLEVLKKIPREKYLIFVSAYQSYLWNEMLREIITARVGVGKKTYPGVAGDYIFYTSLDEETAAYFNGRMLALPGRKPGYIDAADKQLYYKILQARGITPSMFNKVKLRQVIFNSFLRQMIARPSTIACRC